MNHEIIFIKKVFLIIGPQILSQHKTGINNIYSPLDQVLSGAGTWVTFIFEHRSLAIGMAGVQCLPSRIPLKESLRVFCANEMWETGLLLLFLFIISNVLIILTSIISFSHIPVPILHNEIQDFICFLWILFFFLSIYLWLCWAFSSCSERGLLSSCGAWALEHAGFSSCGTQAWLPHHSLCNLPWPGI